MIPPPPRPDCLFAIGECNVGASSDVRNVIYITYRNRLLRYPLKARSDFGVIFEGGRETTWELFGFHRGRKQRRMAAAGQRDVYRAQNAAYRVGSFTLDLDRKALLKAEGAEVPLRPKSFSMLLLLVENAGRTLSKDAIISSVWPGLIVTENNITQCVHEIRNAFGRRGATNPAHTSPARLSNRRRRRRNSSAPPPAFRRGFVFRRRLALTSRFPLAECLLQADCL